MSPEERAENVLRTGFDGRNGSQSFKTLIATAIREAEDAAYERAGKAATQFLGADPFFRAGALFCEASILALKSQEP